MIVGRACRLLIRSELSNQSSKARHTLKEALYGIPIGRFANTARALFMAGFLNAKLCEISWIARNKFWFAVAPTTYAVRKNFHDRNGVFCRRYAQSNWIDTTSVTVYFVRGSGPQSLVTCRRASQNGSQQSNALRVTSGCALMMACLRVRCGSSV
jgi:hypothetical protein